MIPYSNIRRPYNKESNSRNDNATPRHIIAWLDNKSAQTNAINAMAHNINITPYINVAHIHNINAILHNAIAIHCIDIVQPDNANETTDHRNAQAYNSKENRRYIKET